MGSPSAVRRAGDPKLSMPMGVHRGWDGLARAMDDYWTGKNAKRGAGAGADRPGGGAEQCAERIVRYGQTANDQRYTEVYGVLR